MSSLFSQKQAEKRNLIQLFDYYLSSLISEHLVTKTA